MTNHQKEKTFRFAPKVVSPHQQNARSYRISVVIGALASIAIGILGIWVLFFQSDNNISIDLTAVSTNEDGRLELQGLTYRGKTQAGDPFEVIAEKASEDAKDPNIVNLTVVDGEIQNDSNGVITLDSQSGRFNQAKNFVTLKGDVIITQSARDITLTTQYLEGDLTKGDFEAPVAANVTSPTISISGQALSVTNFGDRIVFKGKSKATINEGE